MKKVIYCIILILFFCNSIHAKTVFDQTGRKLIISDNPQRVISLAPNVTEIIFALKEEKRLIAVTTFSDYPKPAKKLPKIGSYIRFDIEKIINLQPDLCIGIKDGNPKINIDRLAEFKIPVYAVNPQSLDSIINAVIEIGSLLNVEKVATLLANNMRKEVNKIKVEVLKDKNRPVVFFQIDISGMFTAGYDTFIHQLITTAGGRNAAENISGYSRFDKEQVLRLSPDIIIIASMKKNKFFRNAMLKWQEFKNIPAVKSNRIFFVDADIFSRPSPRIIDGLHQLFRIIESTKRQNFYE